MACTYYCAASPSDTVPSATALVVCALGLQRGCGVVRRLHRRESMASGDDCVARCGVAHCGSGLERLDHGNVEILALVEWWRWGSPTPESFASFARLSDTPRI